MTGCAAGIGGLPIPNIGTAPAGKRRPDGVVTAGGDEGAAADCSLAAAAAASPAAGAGTGADGRAPVRGSLAGVAAVSVGVVRAGSAVGVSSACAVSVGRGAGAGVGAGGEAGWNKGIPKIGTAV